MTDESPAPKADELAERLQTSLRRQRYRPKLIILAVLTLSVAILVGLGWVLYHPSESPQFQVLALDQVFATGTKPTMKAALMNAAGEHAKGQRGLPIIFMTEKFLAPGEKPQAVLAKSDAQGQAEENVTPEGASSVEFTVRHMGSVDRGRTFVWPAETSLRVVEVEKELLETVPKDWSQVMVANLKPRAEAIAELKEVEKKGGHLVYLLSTRGAHSLKMRAFVRTRIDSGSLPRGPIFDWLHTPQAESSEAIRVQIERELKQHFRGEIVMP